MERKQRIHRKRACKTRKMRAKEKIWSAENKIDKLCATHLTNPLHPAAGGS